MEKCNGKVVFKAKNKKNEQEFELSASALEGEEEDKFWVNFNKKKMECAKTGGRRNKKGDNGKKKGVFAGVFGNIVFIGWRKKMKFFLFSLVLLKNVISQEIFDVF